jgi:hypothetical protein
MPSLTRNTRQKHSRRVGRVGGVGGAAAVELGHAHGAAGTIPLPVGARAAPAHMIKLTDTREITPYLWQASGRGAVRRCGMS